LIRPVLLRNPAKGSRLTLLLVGLLVLTAVLVIFCAGHEKKRISRGFYYWKSTFRLEKSDAAALTRLGVSYLYVKFFDVTWSGGPVPVSVIRFANRPPRKVRMIPTVFITNDTLKKLPGASVTELARKINFKIRRLGAAYALPNFTEVQLDCDWTDSTRQKYFALLQQLKKEWRGGSIQVSATIRLHQIKYYKRTGVPPVDRGMLMFYNMGTLTDFDTVNSILDLRIARRYLANLRHYPLSLDVALPLFSWGVVFQDRRFIGLARGFRRADMRRPVFELYREPIFLVRSNVYLHGTQLYRGDLIRVEESTYDACRQSAALLRRELPADPRRRIMFFDFDQTEIGAIGLEKVDKIYRSFN
jgi:hypothetical protein